MKTKLILGVAAAALLATGAHAADLPAYDPPAAPTWSWTGFHAGVHAGYGWGSARTDDLVDFDLEPDGILGGIQAGYDYQLPSRIVVGVEADIAAADLEDSDRVVHGLDPDSTVTINSHFRVSALATIRARLGYAFDRFLPYVTGGFAWARTKMDYDQPMVLSGEPFTNLSELHHSKSRTGWVLGGGVEYAFTDQLSGKIEYLYADFGTANYRGVALPEFGGIPFEASTRLKTHALKLGVNFHF